MTDVLLQIGLNTVLISLALALVAVVVGRATRRPHIAHVLWLLVFVKLLTPLIVTLPIDATPGPSDEIVLSTEGPVQTALPLLTNPAETWLAVWEDSKAYLAFVWLLGMALVFVWSLVRVYRFNGLLRWESDVASPEVQCVATSIARRLGLKKTPTIYTTSAHFSPLVWWVGGKVRIVVPASLIDQMDAQQFQWILAHELAHVRRRDYLVRWIEWLASVCFWWNPVVWWTRHNLRAHEELCCDALGKTLWPGTRPPDAVHTRTAAAHAITRARTLDEMPEESESPSAKAR